MLSAREQGAAGLPAGQEILPGDLRTDPKSCNLGPAALAPGEGEGEEGG